MTYRLCVKRKRKAGNSNFMLFIAPLFWSGDNGVGEEYGRVEMLGDFIVISLLSLSPFDIDLSLIHIMNWQTLCPA